MSREASLKEFVARLRRGVDKSECNDIAKARERLMELVLLAYLERDIGPVKKISEELNRARSLLQLLHDVDSEPKGEASIAATVWALDAEVRMTELALRLSPRAPTALNAKQGTVKENILMALRQDNGGRLKTKEIASRVNARPETVARALDVLRSENLVDSWQMGQFMANQLSDTGRAAADKLLGEQMSRHIDEVSNEKTIEGVKQVMINLRRRLFEPAQHVARDAS
jgi:DNA-binding transcriptional regulator YhcF (GntR family)